MAREAAEVEEVDGANAIEERCEAPACFASERIFCSSAVCRYQSMSLSRSATPVQTDD